MSDFDIKDYLARKRAAVAAPAAQESAPAVADDSEIDLKDYLARKRAALGQPPAEPTAAERGSAIDIELRPDDESAPPEPSTLDRMGNAVGEHVPMALSNYANALTGGAYRFLRDQLPQVGRNIASGDINRILFGNADDKQSELAQQEDQYAADHPFLTGTAKGLAYVTPFGAPARLGQALDAGINLGAQGAERVAPALVAKGLGYASKTPQIIKSTGGALATNAVTSPVYAAASPEAAGHRGEAALETLKDPKGMALAAFMGLLHSGQRGVLNSEGAKRRELLQTEGDAKVSLLSPGEGGVFGPEGELAGLANLPADDSAIGYAGKVGGTAIERDLAQTHEAKHGYGYREGPLLNQRADENLSRVNQEVRDRLKDVKYETGPEIRDAKLEARMHAQDRATEVLAEQQARHQEQGAAPYAAMREQIESTRGYRKKQDATDAVKYVRKAMRDAGTPPEVRAKLKDEYKLMQRYRVEPPEPEGGGAAQAELAALVAARAKTVGVAAAELDQLIAAKQAEVPPPAPKQPVKYMIPADQVNGFRGTFSHLAGIGKTDSPLGSKHPLRRAYGLFKQLTDQGPYAPMNEVFSESASTRGEDRKALGLKPQLGPDRAAEALAVKNRMIQSMTDPTAFPGGTPEEVSLQQYQDRIDAAKAAQQEAQLQGEAQSRQARENQAATEAKVAAGNADALRARQLLGLNPKIGPDPEVDVMKIKGGLIHPVRNTVTSGGPRGDLDTFREEFPHLRRPTFLPDLVNARADLGFHIGSLKHGGLIDRTAALSPAIAAAGLGYTAATGGHQGWQGIAAAAAMAAIANRKPIAGRVLYPAAKALDLKAINKALSVAHGATAAVKDPLGQKAEAYIELQKGQGQ